VVCEGMDTYLWRARAIEQLGVSGLAISESPAKDTWLFGNAPPGEGNTNLPIGVDHCLGLRVRGR
jgi:hypothetical protein